MKRKKKKTKRNGTKEQLVRHVPEPLAKILYSMMKEWHNLSMKAIITREKQRVSECTWGPGDGIELACLYNISMQKRLIKNTSVKNWKTKKKKTNILNESFNLPFFVSLPKKKTYLRCGHKHEWGYLQIKKIVENKQQSISGWAYLRRNMVYYHNFLKWIRLKH